MGNVLRNILRWFKTRLILVPKRDKRMTYGFIFVFWIVSSISAIIHAIGNPTGATFLSHIGNMGKMVGLNSLFFLGATILLGILFSFLYIPLPRLFLGSFLYATFVHVAILLDASSGTLFSILFGIGYSVAVLLVGLIVNVFMHRKYGRITLFALFGITVTLVSVHFFMDKVPNDNRATQVFKEYTGDEENPAKKGDYDVTFFTYGSGDDIQREEFGEAVDEEIPSVDASDLVTNWQDERASFWGYNAANLPVNGRVWLPDGDGPFPVVLMVHGNHVMEEFSTDGYDYLGELLASRGFITISVDEDFINYSNVSGSPNDNYKLRAWMTLQHIVQLQHMNRLPESTLYQKIDFDQVALMGHSRGGQAVLMAADYRTFFGDDEALLSRMNRVNIKGVVSIAPTDKKIDGNKPHLNNVSYLFLGGGMDADVSDFRGDRQYYRTSFDPGDDGFKSTLYIANANHTQFNTSWGRSDLSMPRGLFLNYRDIMEPDDQREIAKVYMSAFMENIFHDKTSYKELFKDYRYGNEWLPDAKLVNKYQDANYTPIVRYKRNHTESIDVDGFKNWEVITPEDRDGMNRLSDALQLEWDSEASYSIKLSKEDFLIHTGHTPEQLILTMANMDAEEETVPAIDIEVETSDGVSMQLPLDDFSLFPSVSSIKYTAFGLFDNVFRDGKYEQSWEPIFQTFAIPMDAFDDENIMNNEIEKVTLHFDAEPGTILVEEIGLQ